MIPVEVEALEVAVLAEGVPAALMAEAPEAAAV